MPDSEDISIPNAIKPPDISKLSSLLDDGVIELLGQQIRAEEQCKKAIEEYKKLKEEALKRDAQLDDLHRVFVRDNNIIELFGKIIVEQSQLLREIKKILENQRIEVTLLLAKDDNDSSKEQIRKQVIEQVLSKAPRNYGTNIGSINSGNDTEIIGGNKNGDR